MDAGVYLLENEADPTAIRYYYTGYSEGEGGRRSARADVALDSTHPDARAGLLYGFHDDPRFYHMIVASPVGEVEIYRRDGPDLGMTMASSYEPTDTGYARIAVDEVGSELAVRVNGEEVAFLQSEGVVSGSIGTAALGVGRFGFTNYRQTPETTNVVPDASRESPTTITTAQVSSSELPSEALRLKRFDIMDWEGFGQPVVAASLLAPADWRLEGGVRWNPQWKCPHEMVYMQARLVSPDGQMAFEIFPIYGWKWDSNPMMLEMMRYDGCPVSQPFDAASYVARYFVPGYRQGAAVISSEQQPAVAQAAYDKLIQRGGSIFNPRFDATRSRISFSGPSGATEEWVLVTVGVLHTGGSSLLTMADGVASFRAPQGQLDRNERLFGTIVGSMRANPVHVNAVRAVQQQIIEIQNRGFRERMRIIRDSNQRMFDDWNESIEQRDIDWRRQMDQQDRTHQRWNEAIRGTTTYEAPELPGVSYELPSDYEHVWRSGTDEIILTNDPNYNPNESEGIGWTPLRRTQP